MSQESNWLSRFPALARITQLPKPVLMGGAAALVALLAVAALWLRGPDYKVLFANLEDRDGGAVVAALTQMQVPYQFSDHGAAILVPADKVHMARLQLAEQGLPKTGQVGFEVFDNTRFGASQFNEQVSYQRGLEGELATSIETLHSVQKARVHLALPRETLFVRERRAPTASVLLTLYPGRMLNPNQVASITWLVSSSVPGLDVEHVSVVDQNGHLLTASNEAADADAVIAARGLTQISDTSALQAMVDEVLAANPKSVAEFRAGKDKAFNALVGQVMKASRGKANPGQVSALLREKLGAG